MSAPTDRRGTPAGPPRRTRSGTPPLLGTLLLSLLALVFLLPFVLQLATTFKTDPQAASAPLSLIPHPFTLASYKQLFGGGGSDAVPFTTWLGNSVLVTTVVTLGRVFLDSLAGYALARLRFPGRGLLTVALISVMAVPGVVLMIPKFLVVQYLGIYDSYTAMIVPLLVDAVGVFIMKQFFESVPREIEEAARVDGAGVWRTYWSVILPMARPALITLTVLSFQGSWNEFTHFVVTTQSAGHATLTTGLVQFVSGGLGSGTQYPLKLTAALLATIPVAVVFFVFQRHFVRGGSSGAVKE
ncbi:carbohydrate ABC transporter permease [Kitasatospora sp. NBC_01250]|uniref:carbohydrate ABC transporter permease n=1 Tax=unclassified Kitasatospora TaxID=2633591 RepID=UPI002E0D52AD|nr:MULTISPECIES: carbohydrate ABC transporter permease [unclassified Kitasatospora]WSJ70926.1 carbohydrate ABC transporter permease [Kitasatospora sp. NBC_01302]